MASDKLTWISFYTYCPGDTNWTLACDLVSGRVCLTSVAERKLRKIERYLLRATAEPDTHQALLLSRQRIIDNAQFHVAQLSEATLDLIADQYPFHRFQRLYERICSPHNWFIDDSGKSFSCGTKTESLSCITWGINETSPVREMFELIKKDSELSRHSEWW